jgi:mannose-1-phosphate guanylyltransferase
MPLTMVRAKSAVPVAGVPLVLRLIRALADQGVPAVVVNLHHRPDSITSVLGHGDSVGIPIRYSWETVLLGSGGGPRRARELLGERFFILNGDTLVDVDLAALHETHQRAAGLVTMAIADNPNPSRYGGLTVNDADRVDGFVQPGQPSCHFVGVQLVESRVFDPLPANTPATLLEDLYCPLLANAHGAIATHRVSTRFREVGTASDYLQVSVEVARGEGRGDVSIGTRCQIDESAVLCRTVVWDDVTIEAECQLTDCIVTDGVRVPARTISERMIITRVEQGAKFTSLAPDGHNGG